jgi:putative ABC transport system permease protein
MPAAPASGALARPTATTAAAAGVTNRDRAPLSLSMLTLARKILVHDKVKFAVAGAGVSVSVMLVLVQVGLYFGFMENASALIDHSSADFWIAGHANENFDFSSTLDDRTYYRVLETPGVVAAERMLLAFGSFKQSSGGVQSVEVVGLERRARLLRPWNVVAGDADRLDEPDAFVVDRTEAPKLLFDRVGQRTEIGGARGQIVALTHGIRSFTASPFVFTNLSAARAYIGVGPDQFTFVLVRAAPGVDRAQLAARLARIPHADVFDRQAFSQRVRGYWSQRTGVGAGFFTTAALGVVVGLVVVGQILYSGTLEHLREYGTLKAIGAANGAVAALILMQALVSAAVGMAAGTALAYAAGVGLRSANLRAVISPGLVAATALLTVAMCSAAALLSILKVFRLDPASVFKA